MAYVVKGIALANPNAVPQIYGTQANAQAAGVPWPTQPSTTPATTSTATVNAPVPTKAPSPSAPAPQPGASTASNNLTGAAATSATQQKLGAGL